MKYIVSLLTLVLVASCSYAGFHHHRHHGGAAVFRQRTFSRGVVVAPVPVAPVAPGTSFAPGYGVSAASFAPGYGCNGGAVGASFAPSYGCNGGSPGVSFTPVTTTQYVPRTQYVPQTQFVPVQTTQYVPQQQQAPEYCAQTPAPAPAPAPSCDTCGSLPGASFAPEGYGYGAAPGLAPGRGVFRQRTVQRSY